jgi:hypothetical protein
MLDCSVQPNTKPIDCWLLSDRQVQALIAQVQALIALIAGF